jgi:hypothetical protein
VLQTKGIEGEHSADNIAAINEAKLEWKLGDKKIHIVTDHAATLKSDRRYWNVSQQFCSFITIKSQRKEML